ncbi:hypothetical protein [Siminovitchia fortis]|uniref:hypothetical protein n=1 Tax=Siminovitchia fortis TaxID=254758 RepID=UPI0011A50825|nr:hypothetical protein [Siminovitchia fortis]
MFLKKKCLIMLATMTAALLLTACGGSAESKIIGSWKVVINGHVESYLEIGEERIINRSESNDSPISAEYILTETQDDNFMIEFINPENGSHEFMFEGYFDNKNKIIVVNAPGGAVENSELIRVDNIAEEKEKEEKELAKKEEKLAKQKEKKQKTEKEKN